LRTRKVVVWRMMKRRLQRKFKWAESPAVLAEGPLRLHGTGVELSESVFSSDLGEEDLGRYGNFCPYAPLAAGLAASVLLHLIPYP